MTNRSDFQAKILSALAVPIVSAVGNIQVNKPATAEQSAKVEAEITAELLAKSVQLSVALSNGMDLKETESSGDSIRLLLAICSGEIIADRYLRSGKSPSDNDIQKIASAMGAVLTFSDNFVASAESALRIDQIAPDFPIEDETQINIQYISALSPIVGAVSNFSFGRSEQKLVQEITSRLISSAGDVVKSFNTTLSGVGLRRAELVVLKGLVNLFVSAYDSEKTRLLSMDDQARAQATAAGFSLDPVWESYGVKESLVKVLASHISPSQGQEVSHDASTSSAVNEAPPEQGNPALETNQAPQESSQAAVNPAIFQKPVQQPPEQEQPVQAPAPEQTPEQEQPVQQEANPAEEQQSANPMSFFKAKPKDAEGEEQS